MYIYRSCSHRIYRTKSKYLVLQPLLCINIFPFNNLENDNEFMSTVNESPLNGSLIYLSDKIFLPFELNDSDHQYGNDSIDPDLNCFRTLNQFISHNYFVELSFNSEIPKCLNTKQHLSMCHLNIRSLRKKCDCFEMLLDHLHCN